MSIDRKKRLLDRYIRLERWSKVKEVKCEAFCQIVNAVKDKDRDRLFHIIKEFSHSKVNDEEVSWIVDEAIKTLGDDIEHVRQFEEIQIRAKEAGVLLPTPPTEDSGRNDEITEPSPSAPTDPYD